MFILIKRSNIIRMFIVVLALALLLLLLFRFTNVTTVFKTDSCEETVMELINNRNKAILDNNSDLLAIVYDRDVKYGIWAYEHEIKKMKYLHMWSDKQGVEFKEIDSKIVIRSVKESEESLSVNFLASTEYRYSYKNAPDTVDMFRIGTYHLINMKKVEDRWVITKEWYTDPFADSLHLDDIKSADIKEYIIEHEARDLSNLNERRVKSVEYADKYCGAAADEEYGFKYNSEYRNYNPLGGDCANFASQILHEGGAFRKNGTWNYSGGAGSRAWVNAGAFKDYMLYSGRASIIARGTYEQVYKSSYKLLPGDFVAYEKKGDVKHISVVTGVDSKGYSLVNCHNTDRYRVPWDLGWSDKGIRFWLVRVHY